MKKIFLLLSFYLLLFSDLQAQTIYQIGTDTLRPANTLYSPIYRFSATSTTRGSVSNIIFEQSELAAVGLVPGTRIDSLAFQKPNPTASGSTFLFRMLVGSSTQTAPLPTNLNWGTVSAGKQVVVDDSQYTLRADTGWYVFRFSAPFTYTGGTLEIATMADFGSTGVGSLMNGPLQWRYSAGFSTAAIGNTISAAVTGTTALSGTGTALKHRPNIRLYTTPPLASDAALSSLSGVTPPMLSGNSQPFSTVITNLGSNTINSLTLNYQINQGPVITETFTTHIGMGNSATFAFSIPFTVPAGSQFQYRSWISGINGSGNDANAANDTLTGSFCTAIPSGVVTVGNTGDFSDLQSLFNRLNCGGVGGPLTAQILENQTGSFNLQAIPGSAGAGVTLTAVSPVVLSNAGTGTVLSLNGVTNLTLLNLQFERTAAPTAPNFLLLGENCSNIQVLSNVFKGAAGSTSTNNNLVRFNNSQTINFLQNQLSDGNIGYHANASSANQPSFAHVVGNNLFNNFNGTVILLDGAGGSNQTWINANTIRNTNTPATSADGIALTNTSQALLSGNTLTGNLGRYGIHLNNYNGTSTAPNLVANNVVSALFSSTTANVLRLTASGTALTDRDFARVVHNSFQLRTATTSTTANGAIFITGGTSTAPTCNGLIFQNNLVSIGHSANRPFWLRMLHFSNRVYLDSNLVNFSNNFYNNGSDSLVHIASPVQTLANLGSWQALTTGLDQGSLAGNPLVFGLAADDLRPTPNSPLINAGLALSDISSDVTGTSRDANPDIGAYEFQSRLNSAAMASLLSPAAIRFETGAVVPVVVRFTNTGTNAITGITLSYQFGNQPPVTESWAGNLNPGDSTNYTFGTPVNVPANSYGNQNFVAWTSQPNGQADFNAADDTIRRILCIAIPAGTYTVGSPTSDFPNVATWNNLLNCAGISGPVTFNMDFTNNLYTAGTLRFISVPGVSATNTISLDGQGDTVRVEALTGDRALIYLEHTDHVSIRNFHLVSTATNFGIGIHLNGADSIRIAGNRIDLSAVTTTSTTQTNGILVSGSPSSFTASTAQALLVDSNEIIGGNSGIRVVGNSANKSKNLYLGRNTIRDFYQNGIFLVQVDSAMVEQNDINRAQRTSVGTFQGINLETGAEGVMIRQNRIHSSHNSATTRTATSFGIRISAPGTIAKRNYVVNNLVYGFSTSGNQNGILLNATNQTDVLFNTVYLADTLATGNARGIYLQALNQNLRILNNNVVVAKDGAGEKQVLYLERDTTSIQINHNNYYTPSGNGTVSLIHFGTTGYSNLSAWRVAFPQYDSLSVNGNPLFASVAQGNFTPASSVLDAAGTAIPYVSSDFNGASRSALPDLGALEFNPPQSDLAVAQLLTNLEDGCVPSLQIPISVRISNIGNTAFDTLYLAYQINSQPVQRDTIFGGLASGNLLNHTFRQIGTFTNLVDTLVVIAKAGNDNNPVNDTLRRVVNNYLASVVQVPSGYDFEGPAMPIALCVATGDSSDVLLQGAGVTNLPINGNSSLVMTGSQSGSPWTAPSTTNWWTINPNHLSEAKFYVNAPNRGRLNLHFNLRQLFNSTASNTNFRLLVNGQPLAPEGSSSATIRPTNAASSSATTLLRYNLDAFATGGTVEITMQSSVRFNTANATPNANAIDSLRLFESDEIRFRNLTQAPDLCTPAAQLISVMLDTLNAPSSVILHYATGMTFTTVAMVRAQGGMWEGSIPAQAPLTTVRYYVSAQSGSQVYQTDMLEFNNVPYQASLGPDRNLTAGQSTTLQARVNTQSGGFVRFTEFMHFKSPAANIQSSFPSGLPTNADDMIEFANFGSDTLELAGKKMILFGGTSRLSMSFPQGARLAPNAVAVVLPGTGMSNPANQVYYMGSSSNNLLTSSNRNGAVLLDTVTGTLLDVVMTNDSILPADLNLPANAWSGRINSSGVTGIRRTGTLSKGAASWGLYTAIDTTSFGYANTGLSILPPAAQVLWFNGNTQVGTGYSLTVTPTATSTYRVSLPVQGCTLHDTITLQVNAVSQPDLLVSRIMNPVSGTTSTGTALVPRLWVRNIGTATANGFSIRMTVNGTNISTQSFTQQLAANDSLEVSLSGWNPASGNYEVCFNVVTSNEADTTNNSRCVNSVQIVNTTSVAELNALGINLFPNPARESFRVRFPEGEASYRVEWLDASGRMLGSSSYHTSSGHEMLFDVQQMANGIYFMRIANDTGKTSHLRFIVAR